MASPQTLDTDCHKLLSYTRTKLPLAGPCSSGYPLLATNLPHPFWTLSPSSTLHFSIARPSHNTALHSPFSLTFSRLHFYLEQKWVLMFNLVDSFFIYFKCEISQFFFLFWVHVRKMIMVCKLILLCVTEFLRINPTSYI